MSTTKPILFIENPDGTMMLANARSGTTKGIEAAASEFTGRTCHACGAEERRQKIRPVTTTMLHRDDCAVVRSAPSLIDVPAEWRAHKACAGRGCISCPRCHGCGASIGSTTSHVSMVRPGVFCPTCIAPELQAAREAIAAKERALRDLARLAREAPLVALVTNVPEGLDANGWRAAVLAMAERGSEEKGGRSAIEWMTDRRPDFVNTLRTVHEAVTSGQGFITIRWHAACGAYARATES